MKKGCLTLLEHNFFLNEKCDGLFSIRWGLLYTKIQKCKVDDAGAACVAFRYDYAPNKDYHLKICLEYDKKEEIQQHYG